MTRADKPTTDAGYLEAAARIIFMGGLNRRVVDGKWDGFLQAFHGFDVATVAAMGPADVERLSEDDRVIKYAAKLQAVVTNAQEIQEVADQHGSFGSWLESAVAGGVPSPARSYPGGSPTSPRTAPATGCTPPAMTWAR